MLKIYKYCFYRITRFWDHPVHYSLSYDPLTQKVDPTHLISSMGIISLLQISNPLTKRSCTTTARPGGKTSPRKRARGTAGY